MTHVIQGRGLIVHKLEPQGVGVDHVRVWVKMWRSFREVPGFVKYPYWIILNQLAKIISESHLEHAAINIKMSAGVWYSLPILLVVLLMRSEHKGNGNRTS